MLRLAALFLLVGLSSGCVFTWLPPEPLAGEGAPHPNSSINTAASNGQGIADPCANATKENVSFECIERSPKAESLVGQPCELHPAVRLQLDVVRFVGGYVSDPIGFERPGRYIHSCLAVNSGCVRDWSKPFTEVAYCAECRRVRAQLDRSGR